MEIRKWIDIPVTQPNIDWDLLISNLRDIPEIENPEEFVLDNLVHGLFIEYEDRESIKLLLKAFDDSGVNYKICDESSQ